MNGKITNIDELPDVAVLTEKQVAALTGLSRRTLVLMQRDGSGPPRVRLSKKRFGYPLGRFREWLKQREINGEAAA
jgi:predicted DNA-binding transcriptional regulator AlpA